MTEPKPSGTTCLVLTFDEALTGARAVAQYLATADPLTLDLKRASALLLTYLNALNAPKGGETVFDQSIIGDGAKLFVDVWNCQASLAVSVNDAHVRYLVDASYTVDLQEELLDVLDDQGGAVTMSGRYYIAPDLIESGVYPHIGNAVLRGVWE